MIDGIALEAPSSDEADASNDDAGKLYRSTTPRRVERGDGRGMLEALRTEIRAQRDDDSSWEEERQTPNAECHEGGSEDEVLPRDR